MRPVQVALGTAYGSSVSITAEQLKTGDVIAASGVMVLHDGAKVRELPEVGSRKSIGQ